jgi:hypothetical protein
MTIVSVHQIDDYATFSIPSTTSESFMPLDYSSYSDNLLISSNPMNTAEANQRHASRDPTPRPELAVGLHLGGLRRRRNVPAGNSQRPSYGYSAASLGAWSG